MGVPVPTNVNQCHVHQSGSGSGSKPPGAKRFSSEKVNNETTVCFSSPADRRIIAETDLESFPVAISAVLLPEPCQKSAIWPPETRRPPTLNNIEINRQISTRSGATRYLPPPSWQTSFSIAYTPPKLRLLRHLCRKWPSRSLMKISTLLK